MNSRASPGLILFATPAIQVLVAPFGNCHGKLVCAGIALHSISAVRSEDVSKTCGFWPGPGTLCTRVPVGITTLSGDQCDGQSGILNASNFTFGETVYASPLIAAAQSVEGVISVTLSTFTRMDDPSIDGVAQGFLAMGRLEIPHCDNDPNHLDRGQFILHLDGGK